MFGVAPPVILLDCISVDGEAIDENLRTRACGAGVPKATAHFMAISQAPIAANSFSSKVTVAAWSKKPSYAVIGKEDKEINPELQRFMARRAKSETIELEGPHAIFLLHPKEIAAVIEKAGQAAE